MSHKSAEIALRIAPFQGRELDPHYLGFFECFNCQLFFEAHDVLEELWLQERGGSRDLFFKGLIQLAGAFVHLQKARSGPAVALLKLACANFARYPAVYERLDLAAVRALIDEWLQRVESAPPHTSVLALSPPPRIGPN